MDSLSVKSLDARGGKYERLANLLLAKVRRAGPGERLPSERAISTTYNVSRVTARKALCLLREKGIVRRHIGRGTFLARPLARSIRVVLYPRASGIEIVEHFKREAELFSEKHRGMEMHIEEMTPDQGVLETLLAARETAILYYPYIGYFETASFLSPLDELPCFAGIIGNVREEFIGWRSSADGRRSCLSIPLHIKLDAFAFNRRVASRLGLGRSGGPKDWQEMIHWAQTASKAGVAATVFHTHLERLIPFSYYYTASGGLDFLSRTPSGGIQFRFDKGLEWLSFLQDLHDAPGVLHLNKSAPDILLANSKALFSWLCGTWILSQSERSGTLSDLAIVAIPPMMEGGASFSRIETSELAIFPGSGDREAMVAAGDFIHWLLSASSQRRLVSRFASISINSEVFEEQRRSPAWQPFAKILSTGIRQTGHPARFGINAIIRRCLMEMLKGKLTPAEANERIVEFCPLLLEAERERGV